MDRETFVREWVADLRSGKFTQHRGHLSSRTDPNCCCCLGVACHTAARLGMAPLPDEMPERDYVPPGPVRELLGDSNPTLRTPKGHRYAAELNDDMGWTFEQIAQAVERTYLAPEVPHA